MNRDQLIDRTINIYLQIAEAARFSKDFSLSTSMLLAAYDQVQNFSQKVDKKTLTKLAELLAMQELTKQAEKIFCCALKDEKENISDSWLLARIYDGLTEVYIRQAEFEKARKKCEQAIRILTKLPGFDPTLLSSRQRKLALINLHQGHNEKAHELCRQAETMSCAATR